MAILTTRGPTYHGGSRAGSTGWGVVMIVAGLAAIALPGFAGFGVLAVVTGLLLVAGVAHALYSLMTRRLRSFAWHALIAMMYVAAGAYMLVEPRVGLASLALLLAVLFMFEGSSVIGAWWATRRQPRAAWLLANGVLTIGLGLLVLTAWPLRSGEILGLLLGANLVMAGIARLVYRPPEPQPRPPM